MELLLAGLLIFFGIVGGFSVISFLFGSAFEAAGWLGIILEILFILFAMWIATQLGDGKNK